MGTVRARCGQCGERVEVELERAVLALPEETAAGRAGELLFICPTCRATVVRQVHPPLTAVLAASDLTTLPLHDVSEFVLPHPEGPAEFSAPLCLDDVLALHELLMSGDWFSALEAGEFRVLGSGEELAGEG